RRPAALGGRAARPRGGHGSLSSNVRSRRAEWAIALCLLAAAPLLLTAWVHGDGIGYVAMLRSAVIDRDLELRDEFAYLPTHMVADARGLPAKLMRRGTASPGIDPTYQTPAP